MDNFDFSKIDYKYRPIRKPKTTRNIEAIGLDSEADRDGKTFLYTLSTGEVYTPETLLDGLFTREHRGKCYVVFNLKYEQGAILQNLSADALSDLRNSGKCECEGHVYKVVGYKNLRISRGKNSVVFWDMYSFFEMSLASAARHYTSLRKYDLDVEKFTPEYITKHWDRIARYSIRDAEITAELFRVLKGMCAKLGICPTTFYSIATIGYKYARETTHYQTVNHLWYKRRDVLEAACKAYSGGKFEVTTRGKGKFYEYDINSAYPYEMANLINIQRIRVIHDKQYRPGATYGFLHLDIFLGNDTPHPVAYKRGTVNIFPVGRFKRWVTKTEYEYLKDLPGAEIKILKGIWLYPRFKYKPYLPMIKRLFAMKAEAKARGDKSFYKFCWRLTNSLYGKQVQLVRRGDRIEASTCWNPIYGAVITANVRVRIARVQKEHPEVVAVHTDSVISQCKLPLDCGTELGQWRLTEHGLGVIIGCGFYQIGKKVRVRGFPFQESLFDILNKSPPDIAIPDTRAVTWRMVAVNHWDTQLINRFVKCNKVLNINFDTKRIWDYNWQDGDDALDRVIPSIPYIVF